MLTVRQRACRRIAPRSGSTSRCCAGDGTIEIDRDHRIHLRSSAYERSYVVGEGTVGRCLEHGGRRCHGVYSEAIRIREGLATICCIHRLDGMCAIR